MNIAWQERKAGIEPAENQRTIKVYGIGGEGKALLNQRTHVEEGT